MPFLIGYAEAKETSIQGFYRTNWFKLPARLQKRLPRPLDIELRRIRAVIALGWLGAAAQPAVPALIKIETKSAQTALTPTATYFQFSPSRVITTNRLGIQYMWARPALESEVLQALLRIGGTNEALIPALLAIAKRSPTIYPPWVEQGFVSGNFASATEHSLEILRRALVLPEPRVRHLSVLFLSSVPREHPELIPDLIARLSDENRDVSDVTERALVRAAATNKELVAALIRRFTRSLEDSEPLHQIRIASMLADIGPPAAAALPILRPLTRTEKSYLRYEAARGLWRIGHDPSEMLFFWLKNLEDQREDARWQTLLELASLGGDAAGAVPAITRRLRSDPSPRIRGRAAITLRDIGPAAIGALPALKEALLDEYSNVREAAAEAIPRINAATDDTATAQQ